MTSFTCTGLFLCIKTKSHLSVCPHFFWHVCSSVVSQWIDARFEAPVFRYHSVHFKKVLIAVVGRLRCFECQGVDDFLLNLQQHSCKPQLRFFSIVKLFVTHYESAKGAIVWNKPTGESTKGTIVWNTPQPAQ